MDAIQFCDKIEHSKHVASEQLLSPCSSSLDDLFGEPDVHPRVGDLYQAEIPSLALDYDHLQPIDENDDKKAKAVVPNSFLLGLPIPIVWAYNDSENMKNRNTALETNGESEFDKSEGIKTTSASDDAKLKFGAAEINLKVVSSQQNRSDLSFGEKGCKPLPHSSLESWSDIEHLSFLLGLYVFGKNLLLVKRFVSSKKMGDILSFYYGKFYRSGEYSRWSDCRKRKSRKCIHRRSIFTGWRQQELLSRLSSYVSKECLEMLAQVSRTFGDGKLSLEDYVFTLRDAAGVNNLVEAVGIGKGKQDLTGISNESLKTNHVFSFHLQIPIGKACSTLTSADIIKFLKGDLRLSKARSSDLFWEAVWPRLLERGWHSEQPKNSRMSIAKHSLVFLMPGVKKFSKKRLVKGNHYFDSVSDVLNKVASDPGLLEGEIEATCDSDLRKDYRDKPQIKREMFSLSSQLHHYLQPRKSNCHADLMKFTIVDTSSVHGKVQSKVRELRSIPIDTLNTTFETENGTFNESKYEKTIKHAEDESGQGTFAGPPGCLSTPPDSSIDAIKRYSNRSTIVSKNKHFRNPEKYQRSKKLRSSHLKPLPSHSAAVGHEVSCLSTDSIPTDKLNEADKEFQVVSQNFSSSKSSLRPVQNEGIDGVFNGNSPETDGTSAKARPKLMIDLNIPHVPPDFASEPPFVMDMMHNHDNAPERADVASSISETKLQSGPSKPSVIGADLGHKSSHNGRRQSTRIRPLSTKALEALACGFSSTERKRKSGESVSQNDSRFSRHVHSKTGGVISLNTSISNYTAVRVIKDEGADGNHNSDNMAG